MNTNLNSPTLPSGLQTSLSFQSLALVKPTNNDEQLDRPSPNQKQAIARIYAEQAWIYFQEHNLPEAVVACRNALELDGNNANAYKILGNILKVKGKKAEALGVYAKALEINPNSASIHANLGSFYAEQKKWHEALDYYQQAVILDPNLAGAYRSLAQVWEELGEVDRALECLCQAVNLEPDKLCSQEYFSFGKNLYEQGKLKEASIFYIRGVELEPQAESELAFLVKILEEMEDWQQAVVYYHQLISQPDSNERSKSSTENKPIRNLLSRSKTHHSKNTVNAEASCQLPPSSEVEASHPQAAETKPNTAVSWNNLGSLYAKKQQWIKAISCYKEAVELDPNLSKSYRNLARVYRKIGKLDRATLCWYEASMLEPETVKPEEYFDLAKNLLQYQQIDKAIACLRRTIELKPDFSQANLFLGRLYEQQGRTAEAKACYSAIENSSSVN